MFPVLRDKVPKNRCYAQISAFDVVYLHCNEPQQAISHVLESSQHCEEFHVVAIELLEDYDILSPILFVVNYHPSIQCHCRSKTFPDGLL